MAEDRDDKNLNQAARALGRRGGLALRKKMTPAQRKAAAMRAARARWKGHIKDA